MSPQYKPRYFLAFLLIGISIAQAAAMSSDLQEYSNKLGVFSLNMYSKINLLQPDQNVVFSPLSIQACAAMTRLGATGETARELDQGLQLPSTDVQQIAETFNTVLSKYKNSTILKIANKIYVMQNYKIKERFNELTTKNFYSAAEEVDFSASTAAAKTINSWVESKTNNLIKDLIPASALDSSTRLVLINAIHFKGEWKTPFLKERTKPDLFYLNEKDTVEVPMMNLKARFRYGEIAELDAKALELPYRDTDLSMFILLPNSKTGLKNLEQGLQKVSWETIKGQMNFEEVTVKLPKFKAEFSIELSEAFKQLGMARMFSDSAEFEELLDSKEALKVSKVIHKAFIDVNEEGTEAAASTASVIRTRRAINYSVEFHAEHPFFYFIYDQSCPTFMGSVVHFENLAHDEARHDEL